jgi:K+-sensing histidine kinase KdpD
MNNSVIMTDHAEGPTGGGVRRTLARWNIESNGIRSPILRYGLSVVSVAIGLGLALMLQHYQFRDVELPVLTLSVALTTWYAGAGPSVLAILLATACFNYFFTEPFYTFYISSSDLPYFFVFLAWAVIVASFAAVRRRVEENLRQARDHLQVEVEQRKRREDEIRTLNKELVKRAAELETSNNELESFAYSVRTIFARRFAM